MILTRLQKEAGKWVKRVMEYGPVAPGSSWRRRREEKGFGGVVSFNMHSPGEEERAALSAGAPVWPLWRRDLRRPGSQTSFHRWCRPGARRSASRWCCPWRWPRRTQNLERKQGNSGRGSERFNEGLIFMTLHPATLTSPKFSLFIDSLQVSVPNGESWIWSVCVLCTPQTHPGVQTAAGLCLRSPLARHPCRTCFLPAAPGRCPTSTS